MNSTSQHRTPPVKAEAKWNVHAKVETGRTVIKSTQKSTAVKSEITEPTAALGSFRCQSLMAFKSIKQEDSKFISLPSISRHGSYDDIANPGQHFQAGSEHALLNSPDLLRIAFNACIRLAYLIVFSIHAPNG